MALLVQVAALQSQVVSLQQTAHTQQEKLERLSQEALLQGSSSAEQQAALQQDTQAAQGSAQHLEHQRWPACVCTCVRVLGRFTMLCLSTHL